MGQGKRQDQEDSALLIIGLSAAISLLFFLGWTVSKLLTFLSACK